MNRHKNHGIVLLCVGVGMVFAGMGLAGNSAFYACLGIFVGGACFIVGIAVLVLGL
jgi:hypothetical protein